MASSRRKQDEKHLKILRHLVSLPGNKQCFDCDQRGPTYVNITIGSFVCTTCSGLLRGLTPPHRVKSISMTTFTSEEIESLQSRGNEYCRKVWLALYDSDNVHNAKDEHLVRDFMVAKYEKKLYYMDPSAVMKNGNLSFGGQSTLKAGVENSRAQHSLSDSSPVAPSQSIFMKNPQIHGNRIASNLPAPGPDLFRIVPVPSARQRNQVREEQQLSEQNQQQSFANFDNNPIFNSQSVTNCFPSPKSNFTNATGEDKYAALKDLDCLMKMQQESPKDQGIRGNGWSTSQLEKGSSSNPFQNDIGNNNVVNPFRTTFVHQGENNNGTCENAGTGVCAGVNTSHYSSNPWGGGGEGSWTMNGGCGSAGEGGGGRGGGLTTSQTFPFSNWNGKENLNIITGNSNNPFL